MEPNNLPEKIVIRDNLQDQGGEPTQKQFQSPDILVSRKSLTESEILAFEDFTKDFSQGLPKPKPSQPDPSQPDTPKPDFSGLGLSGPGQTNFVYLRGRLNVNQMVNIEAKLYTIPIEASGALGIVKPIGTPIFVGAENTVEFVIKTPIQWDMGSDIDGEVAHYYLIASLAIPGAPHPDPNGVQSPNDLVNFIRKNSNVAAQNFVTLNLLPGGKSKSSFLIQGLKEVTLESDLVIDPTDLPENSAVTIKLLKAFTKTAQYDENKVEKKSGQALDDYDKFIIKGIQEVTIKGTTLEADERFVAEIEVKIPTGTDHEIQKYTVRIRQKQGEDTIGGVNVHARVIGLNKAEYLGSVTDHFIEESTYSPYRMANRDEIIPFLSREEARIHGFDWGPNTLNEIFEWFHISYSLGKKIRDFIGSVENAKQLVDDIKVTRFVGNSGRLGLAVRVAESIIDLTQDAQGIFELLESIQEKIEAEEKGLESFVDLVNSCKVNFHESARPSVPENDDKNVNRAQRLLNGLFDDESGAQKEYLPDQSENRDVSEHVENVLTQFGRVWVYSQGIALHQAARRFAEAVDGHKAFYKFRADKLMDWLFEHATDEGVSNEGKPIIGWHFSENTIEDNFKDPRLVTGANAWALNGVAKYITSDVLNGPEEEEKKARIKAFYSQMLEGLLVHQNADGLFSAGWDFKILQNIGEDEKYIKDHIESDVVSIYSFLSQIVAIPGFDPSQNRNKQMESIKDTALLLQFQKIGDIILKASDYKDLLSRIKNNSITNPKGVRDFLSLDKLKGRSYNKILGIAGYKDDEFYPNKITRRPWYDRIPDNAPEDMHRDRVMAKNVVTEHNLDMLAVLNFATENACKLDLDDQKRQELLEKRCHLRDAIFTKLYDHVKKRFITGRGPDDSPSRHTAIDNASWLALSAKLKNPDCNGIWPEQRKRLANGLLYTIENFTQPIDYKGANYFGAHYFEPDFADPYIERAPFGAQKDVYHIEATTGLIIGLKDFKNSYRNHKFSTHFKFKSDQLWSVVQRFSGDHGFLYGTKSIQDLFEPLESSTTATWYIDTHDEFVKDEDPKIEKPDSPPFTGGEVITLFDEYLRCPYRRWGEAADSPEPNITVDAQSKTMSPRSTYSFKITFKEDEASRFCGITLTFLGKFRNQMLFRLPKNEFINDFKTEPVTPSSRLVKAIEEKIGISLSESSTITPAKSIRKLRKWYLEDLKKELSYGVFLGDDDLFKFFRREDGVSLAHASKLTFDAKANPDGMRVDFAIGSAPPPDTIYYDSAGTGGKQGGGGYAITDFWEGYEIPLNPRDGDWLDINELFTITFKRASFGGAGWGKGTIWLDNIKFVRPESAIPQPIG